MASPTNVRFPDGVDANLSAFAGRTGEKKATVVVHAVDEWLRMQAHPRIRFVTRWDGERQAALMTGPEIWTVIECWLQQEPHERTPEIVAECSGQPIDNVAAALSYYAEYTAEFDGQLARHWAAADEAEAAWLRRRALDAG
jgi:hypothetical protein